MINLQSFLNLKDKVSMCVDDKLWDKKDKYKNGNMGL